MQNLQYPKSQNPITEAQELLEVHARREPVIAVIIKRLLESGQWRRRDPNKEYLQQTLIGEPILFDDFVSFVEHSRPWGLGLSWPYVYDWCNKYVCLGTDTFQDAFLKAKSAPKAPTKTTPYGGVKLPNLAKRALEALAEREKRALQIPDLIEKIKEAGEWYYREPAPGKLKAKNFSNFKDFVQAPQPWGLQTKWADLVSLNNIPIYVKSKKV